MMNPHDAPGSDGEVRGEVNDFLRFFLPGVTILCVVLAGFYYLDYSLERELIAEREKNEVVVGARDIDQIIDGIAKDVSVLANSVNLGEYLDSGDAAALEKLGREFYHFSRSKQSFDQVRFLDDTGQEQVRVNFNSGNIRLVAADRLQNKGKRYYFTDTYRLAQGTLFVSPLDLNMERGEIERPLKPMIRIGTPVFDSAGHKRGIVLVNYFGGELLASLRKASQGTAGDSMLLNRDGYWLMAPDPGDEWGFMFGTDRRFSDRYAKPWAKIRRFDKGQLITDAGIFTWETVYPLKAGVSSADGSAQAEGESQISYSGREYFWKVVTRVPSSRLQQEFNKRLKYGLVLLFALSVLVVVGSAALALARQRVRKAVDQLRRNERRLRAVTSELAEGLVVLNEHGEVNMMNPEAERLLGWHESAIQGQRFLDLVQPVEEGGESMPSPIDEAMSRERVRRVEEDVFCCNDGSHIPVAYTAAPMNHDGQNMGGLILSFQDITERKRLREELERMASHDPLTGLCNRRETERFLQQMLRHDKRYGRPVSICMLDIDHFKRVNDSFGHQAGDEVLRELGALLNELTRDVDCSGRYGGEEFILVLPETPLEGALVLAERIRMAAADLEIDVSGCDKPLRFTVSIGVSALAGGDGRSTEGLINAADRALYQAKSNGRNRVEVADD